MGTLTIEPGVTVKVGSDRWIAVLGTLVAVGTPTEPIVITTNTTPPTPGSWRTLNFQGSTASNSQVAYVTVSYGGRNSSQGAYYGNLRVLSSAPSLDHVTVTGSSTAGLWVSGSTAAPTVTNSTFTGNSGPGVWVLQLGTATIADSTTTGNGGPGVRAGENLLYNQTATAIVTSTEITGNNGAGVLVDKPATATVTRSTFSGNGSGGIVNAAGNINVVTASLNYWDSPTGPSGGGFGDGQSVSQGVDFEPWLVGAPSFPHFFDEATAPQRTFNPGFDIPHRLEFTTSLIGDWSVAYTDGAGNPVRTLTGSGGTGSVSWDGLDTNGQPIPTATYTYDLASVGPAGEVATVARGLAILDDLLDEINFSVEQLALEFNPAAGETVDYVSFAPIDITETLVIKNADGDVVRTLVNGPRTAGERTDTWDGLDDAGVLVRDGPYFYIATATWSTHTMTWDLSGEYVSSAFVSPKPTVQPYDPFNNQPMTVSYDVSWPGRTMVVVSTQPTTFITNCDPPNFCIKDWAYEPSGPQTVQWAGVDESGDFLHGINAAQIERSQGLGAGGQAYRKGLEKNAVIVYGTRPAVSNVSVTPPLFNPSTGTQEVSFDLATFQGEAVDAEVTFYNQESGSVLRTVVLQAQTPGTVTWTWDGRAEDGLPVAPGIYTVTVRAVDVRGNEASGRILTRIRY